MSKIIVVNVITFLLALVPTFVEAFPDYVAVVALVGPALTVILRKLQGKEVKLGSKTIKL